MKSYNSRKIKYKAFRNIPTAKPRKHLFDDGINTGDEQDQLLDWANETSGIEHERSVHIKSKDTWYKYGELEKLGEFLFDKVNLPKSRFTDGTSPVWYGAQDIDVSLAEIEFHLKRSTINELEANLEGSIIYERAMCEAELDLHNNLDVKYLKKTLPYYNEVSSYDDCIKEFIKLKGSGVTSLTYASARESKKECYAITKQEEVLSSKVINFWRIIVYSNPQRKSLISEIPLED